MHKKVHADPIIIYVGNDLGIFNKLYHADRDIKIDSKGCAYFTKGIKFSVEPDRNRYDEGEELLKFPSVIGIYYASGDLPSDNVQVVIDQKRLVQRIVDKCKEHGWSWTIASTVYEDKDFE